MHDSIDHWRALPDDRGVEADEVHVWRVTLDRPEADARRCFQLLSADELQRVERLHAEQDRFRFAAGRAALRTILGRILDEGPARLVFEYAKNGKPRLAQAAQESTRIQREPFTLTGARCRGLVAACRRRRGTGPRIGRPR